MLTIGNVVMGVDDLPRAPAFRTDRFCVVDRS
jgi:hypothetical protein